MVYIDDQKFACQSCIKGHRSSSCNHTDRPLFEIRKKGRPATQCDACRDLRRTKKLHVKCVCAGRKDPEADVGPVQIQSSSSAASSSRKGGRKIPTVPKLPHGIKDLDDKVPLSPLETQSSSSSLTQSAKQSTEGSPSMQQASSAVAPNSAPSSATPVGPSRTCCCRKSAKHSRSPSLQSSGDASALVQPAVDPSSVTSALSLQTTVPQLATGISAHPSVPATSPVDEETSPIDEEMACHCGPSCLCQGCTKHSPYGDSKGTGNSVVHGMGCPPDCQSCTNENGFVLASTSRSCGRHAFNPTKGRQQPGPSHFSHETKMLTFGSAMEGYWDDELDAEGSPDPDYIMLPDVLTTETHKGVERSHSSGKAASTSTSRPSHTERDTTPTKATADSFADPSTSSDYLWRL